VIHIARTTGLSKEYEKASEAAKSFDNVSVVNSETVSSSTGILVLIAYKLMQQGLQAKDILAELEAVKHRVKCSFVIDTTDYMEKKGLVTKRVHKLTKALTLHPALRIRNDKAGVGGIWLGRPRRAYRRYINHALPPDVIPDSDVVFITYVDLPQATLDWIEEEIKKTAYFEHVIFQQASAAISSNCGPGAFGILYLLKSNKSYNIASYLEDMTKKEAEEEEKEKSVEDEEEEEALDEAAEKEEEPVAAVPAEPEPEPEPEPDPEPAEPKWYQQLDSIDAEAAIKNSGSEDAFKAVLKIFFDSIPDRSTELETAYSTEDWETYTIKIHALKSSSRLVGALDLGDKAEKLEMAGKEKDVSYIRENHAPVMEQYLHYKDLLAPLYNEGSEDGEEASEEPVADEFLIEGIYEGLLEAANAMDCDMVEEIMKEIDGYSIPESEAEKFRLVREKADMLDYDGMIEVLKNKQ
jgi:DegV family protein with EDD domain